MLRSVIILTFSTDWAAAVSSLTLSPCTSEEGNMGFICQGYGWCWPYWCRDNLAIQCSNQLGEEFLTNDTELCGDSLFWSEQTCDWFHRGEKVAIGQRCSGGTQHCIYPWYNTPTYSTYYNLITCVDFSDRVFTVNETCTEEKYLATYNKTVCYGDLKDYNANNCKDLEGFMRENSTDYWNPHNCTDSCSDPGYGCRACTNPEYFLCTRNNTSVCIHPELVCNKYQDCDNGRDEDPMMCGEANEILSSSFVFILSIAVMLGLNSQNL